ncbi:MAG: hypothetical protein DRP84_12390 [Spirochaetes bacterium]|nr:MAG: hypothetical protein DRP84_12390 [Spirochaetota bacterium]
MQFLTGAKKKRNIVLLVILIVLFIAVFTLLYNTFWKDTGISLISGVIVGGERIRPLDTSFNSELFSGLKFRSLQEYVELPVRSGAKGQTNPFYIPE